MENNNFDQKILDTIKARDLAPRPKWHFLLKNYLVWTLGGLSLLVGALSVAVIIYLIENSGWEMYPRLNTDIFEFAFVVLPGLWIIILIGFIFLMDYNIKHTKKGYRYPLPLMVILSIGSSIVLGIIFQSLDIGQAIDDVLCKKAPLYTRSFNRHIDFWSNPERGRLAGLIVATASDLEYVLVDRDKREWLFNIEKLENEASLIQVGRPVRSLGQMVEEDKFMAIRILPMGPGREFFMRPEQRLPMDQLKYFRSGPKAMPGPNPQELKELFEKYPEFKNAMLGDLVQNKAKIMEIIMNNPEILVKLQGLDIIPKELLEGLGQE